MFDENKKPVLKPINIDLPCTIKDEKEFNELVNNFEFKEEDTTRITLTETTCDEINDAMKQMETAVSRNSKENKKTFVLFFYAGHGAMLNNE